jgi:hypothetical protein
LRERSYLRQRPNANPASRRCAPLRTQLHRYSGTGIAVTMPGARLCRVAGDGVGLVGDVAGFGLTDPA